MDVYPYKQNSGPYSQGDQLFSYLFIPAFIGLGINRARVEYRVHNPSFLRGKEMLQFCFGIFAHSNEIDGLNQGNHIFQVAVTNRLKGYPLSLGKLVRGDVFSCRATIHEDQRTIIDHSEGLKAKFRRTEALTEKSPKPFAAHFTPFDIHTQYRSRRMFKGRLANLPVQLQEIPYGIDLPKRHTVLRHPKGAWVHTEEEGLNLLVHILTDILLMEIPRIEQGIVDNEVSREAQRLNLRPELKRTFQYLATYIIHSVIL